MFTSADHASIDAKGMETIKSHAADFIARAA
jgi:hypothetical protein